MRIAKEQLVTSGSLNYLSESAYDSTKWNLGKGIIYNNGVTTLDKYIAPQFDCIRPLEESTAFAVITLFSYNFSSTYDYLFGLENSTAASATRRIHLWRIDKKNGTRSWRGFISLVLATATAHTARDFKVDIKLETTGTVDVSGFGVTGASTLFSSNRVSVGTRIGFGSTSPSDITDWYRISAVNSDTSLTLGATAIGVTSSLYVAQEFRPMLVATNATTTNGGIHLAKGVSIEDFTSTGVTFSSGATADGRKAVYWLKDANTQTNIVAAGSAIDFSSAGATTADCYVLDLPAAGAYKMFKYNIRAQLTGLTAAGVTGASTAAFQFVTGTQSFTGTGTQNSNLAIATAGHGTGTGVKSLYFVTTTRVYRAATANVLNGDINWISDNITEIPPGGVSTYAATSVLSTIEYIGDIDAFIFGTTHANAVGSYVSKYVASGAQFSNIFGRNTLYLEQSLKDNSVPTHFSNQSTVFSYNDSGSTNLVYATKQGTTQSTHGIYILPFGTHWTYSSENGGILISPSITTPNADKFYRVHVNCITQVGTGELTKPTDPIEVYARTTNINTDSTSGWIQLNDTGDISSFSGSSAIQFMIEFKTISELCLPRRILGFEVVYEDNTTDSHYQFSVTKSNATSKQFAWRFATAFGATVSPLRVRLYDAVTAGTLVDDNTTTPTGTFERSTDGSAWGAWNNTDKTNETTYLRYTPASLADNINVRPVLTIN